MADIQQSRAPRIHVINAANWRAFDRERETLEKEREARAATAHANDFYDHITSSEHVGVTELVPYLTLLPDVGMPLARRDDTEKFGVEQVLYAIVRAGNHGFALATAYNTARTGRHPAKRKARPGHSYITKINEYPHDNVTATEYLSPLLHNAPSISLGGSGALAPELAEQGLNLLVSANRGAEIRLQLQAKRLGKLPFQLITAVSPLSHRRSGDYNPLDEVGTWAPAPAFILPKLKLINR